MTDHRLRSDVRDEPVFFPEEGREFFGFVTSSAEAPASNTGVILLDGSGGGTTIGRNRMWVNVARMLATRGHTAMRLDYSGAGDSIGEATMYNVDRPAVPEIRAACDVLTERGVDRFILVGTCYGSLSALAGAVGEPRVQGLIMLAPPVRKLTKGRGGAAHIAQYNSSLALARKAFNIRMLRKLVMRPQARLAAKRVVTAKLQKLRGRQAEVETEGLDPSREVSPEFKRNLRRVLHNGVPVHIVYGTDEFLYTEFQEAAEGSLGPVLEEHEDQLDIVTIPGVVRGFLSLRIQEAVQEHVMQSVDTWSRA